MGGHTQPTYDMVVSNATFTGQSSRSVASSALFASAACIIAIMRISPNPRALNKAGAKEHKGCMLPSPTSQPRDELKQAVSGSPSWTAV